MGNAKSEGRISVGKTTARLIQFLFEQLTRLQLLSLYTASAKKKLRWSWREKLWNRRKSRAMYLIVYIRESFDVAAKKKNQ